MNDVKDLVEAGRGTDVIREALSLLNSMIASGERHSEVSRACHARAMQALVSMDQVTADLLVPAQPAYAITALTFSPKGSQRQPEVVVKFARDEAQAKRELERMVLVVMPTDMTRADVRRTSHSAEVVTHTKDGCEGAVYNFSIQPASRVCE